MADRADEALQQYAERAVETKTPLGLEPPPDSSGATISWTFGRPKQIQGRLKHFPRDHLSALLRDSYMFRNPTQSRQLSKKLPKS
jgi:hypothetical protein